MQIGLSTFFSDITHVLDSITADFIQHGFEQIHQYWIVSGFLDAILTLYIISFLYSVSFDDTPIKEVTKHLIKVCFAFGLATHWDIFYKLIYNVFTNEPTNIVNNLISKTKGQGSSIDEIFAEGVKQGINIITHASGIKAALLAIVSGAVMIIATVLFSLAGFKLILMSKFYLAILLALSPYFIIASLFNGTKGLTESWMKACLNAALIPVFVGCILMFSSTLAKMCLNTGNGFSSGQGDVELTGVVVYLLCSLIALGLFEVVPEKVAAITASLAMQGASKMLSHGLSTASPIKEGASRLGKGATNAKADYKERQKSLYEGIALRAELRKNKEGSSHGTK